MILSYLCFWDPDHQRTKYMWWSRNNSALLLQVAQSWKPDQSNWAERKINSHTALILITYMVEKSSTTWRSGYHIGWAILSQFRKGELTSFEPSFQKTQEPKWFTESQRNQSLGCFIVQWGPSLSLLMMDFILESLSLQCCHIYWCLFRAIKIWCINYVRGTGMKAVKYISLSITNFQ